MCYSYNSNLLRDPSVPSDVQNFPPLNISSWTILVEMGLGAQNIPMLVRRRKMRQEVKIAFREALRRKKN